MEPIPVASHIASASPRAARWTFVIGKDGTVAYKNTKVTPGQDAKAVAEFIRAADAK